MNPSPRVRLTARILVLNERDQLLLFEYQEADGRRFWVTPGGGLEPGETFEEAAKRELLEETGLELEHVGNPVWERRKILNFTDERVMFDERHFVVRVRGAEVSGENPDELERGMTVGHRWWSLEELSSTSEMVYPENLARHLEPILRGEMPTEPVDISLEIAP
jgi:8-oxo-dGTP pyrophosphatase MutT (NUDIX family)